MVTVAAVSTIPEERWSTTPIARIMHRVPMPVLTPECSVSEALDILAGATFAQLPVVRDGWVTGMFGRNDIARYQWLRGRLGFQGADSENGRARLPRPKARSPRSRLH